MEDSVIAVQVADGSFVPVLTTSSSARRRLILTTVKDGQRSVRIRLYRGSDEMLSDAEYLGSLVMDDLEPAEHGSPDISLVLGTDETGNLIATATDTASGRSESAALNLEGARPEGAEPADVIVSDTSRMEELSFEETAEVEEFVLEDSGIEDLSFEDGEETAAFTLEDIEEAGEPAAEEEPEDVEFTLQDESVGYDASLAEEDFTFDELAATGDEPDMDTGELDQFDSEEFDRLDSEGFDSSPTEAEAEESEEAAAVLAPRRSNAVIFIGYLILALAALAVLTYFVFRLLEGPPVPPLREASVWLPAVLLPAGRAGGGR